MSKQEFMKTCVLRVNIHCDGCKQKVRKLLQKIDGVYSVSIDAEQGKVAVSGCVDPAKLIKKLEKSGKHAELWGHVQKGGSIHNQVGFNNQLKNMSIDGKNKPQKGGKDQPKGVQVQHVKGANKDMVKVQPPKDQKSVKFNLPEEEFDMSDHDFDEFGDDFDDEFDDDDDEFDDEYDEGDEFGHGHGHGLPNKGMMPNKVNVMQGNGNGPYGKMMPMMAHGPYGPKGGIDMHAMNDKKGGGGGGGKKGGVIDFPLEVKGKGKGNKEGKGGVIDFPIEMKGKGGGNKDGKNGNGGKKGGGEGKGGGVNGKKMSGGEKNGGKKKKKGGLRGLFGFGKKSSSKGGSVSKKGSNNNGSFSGDEKKISNGKKSEWNHKKHENNKMKNDFEIDITSGHGKGGKGGGGAGKVGQMGDMGRGSGTLGQMGMGPMGHGGNGGNVGQMGMGPMGGYPMGHMGGVPAVQGLPAQAMMNNGYYQGMGMGPGPGHVPANPYSQQQYMAMMMNQQRGNGSDMFQPMMYSRPHPAVNYAAPVPSHPPTDSYTHFFSDENTESCSIM
ncbi:heavy metal-associated isoprenylated plant protein 34 isoform X2 [Morus notabilis]|uniref:heavy metal-associated isoprenylated plant protein 34 isoform X2 n=1 Tax=Morus notabilis TaxID=981085 RepID=UPI000CECE90F|nr:heavy metal-associated isoprenylated plant protein 34 isoform X2 [Morus notabilis]